MARLTFLLVLLACLSFAATTYHVVNAIKPMTTKANDPNLIARINDNNVGWKAKAHKIFEGRSLQDIRRMLGIIVDDSMLNFYLTPKKNNRSVASNGSKKAVSGKSANRSLSSSRKLKMSKNGKTNGNGGMKKQVKKTNSAKRNTKNSKRRVNTSGGVATLAKKPKKSSSASSSSSSEIVSSPPAEDNTPIPDSFDARKKWPACVLPVRAQMECGSCWAFTASGVFANRKCISSGAQSFQVMSPDYLVRCNTDNLKCVGGYTDRAWKFIQESGLPTDSCVQYRSGYGNVLECPTQCDDGSPIQLQKAIKGMKLLTTADQIKRSIMNEGAVHAQMTIYRDFVNYQWGIYSVNSDTVVGAHAVQIIGWGAENGVEYWLCINSWSEYWGENGYFRIGVGQAGIALKNVFGPKV